MKLPLMPPHLSRILTLCYKHSFLVPEIENGLNYGPLGLHFKRNILQEWCKFLLKNNDFMIFPVSPPISHYICNDFEGKKFSASSLFNSILQHYVPTLHLVGGRLPFGLSHCGICVQERVTENTETDVNTKDQMPKEIDINHLDIPFLLQEKLCEWNSLNIVFFCPAKKSTYWFNHWLHKRLVWWRKFAGSPSNFSMTDITKNDISDQQASLQYQFPWGVETVEKIYNKGSKSLSDIYEKHLVGNDGKSDIPHIIFCEANLDLGVMAYLCDAFQEKQRLDSMRTILRIHRHLVPYKVTVAISTTHADRKNKLQSLAEHLVKDMTGIGIFVLPNPDLYNQASLEFQFGRFDEMGILYTVVLRDSTLKTGSVGLRNRDTTLEEEIHVASIKHTLLKYLGLPIFN